MVLQSFKHQPLLMQMFISTSIFTGKKWSSGYLFEQKTMGQNCIQNTPKQKRCQKKPESHQTTTRTAPPSSDLQTVVIPETPICEIAKFIITNHQCQKNPKPTRIKSQQSTIQSACINIKPSNPPRQSFKCFSQRRQKYCPDAFSHFLSSHLQQRSCCRVCKIILQQEALFLKRSC